MGSSMKNHTGDYNFCGRLLVFSMIMAMALFAASNVNSYGGKMLNVSISGRPVTYLPSEIEDVTSAKIVHNNLCESLVRYGERRMVIEPCLAEEWQVEEAGRIWVFRLKNNVRFHDGSPFSSDDVVRCFSENQRFTGKVEKLDSYRVRFVLQDRRSDFNKTISQATFAIYKLPPEGGILGTGPFKLDVWDPEDRVTLLPFEDYWGLKPDLDGIVFHCLMDPETGLARMKRGEIDIVDIVPPSLASEVDANDNLVLSIQEGVSVSYIFINNSKPPLDSVRFRCAINTLINRETIIRDVYSGQAIECRGLLPPVIGGQQEGPPRFVYQADEAQRVIKEYLGNNGRTFKMLGLPCPRPYCPDPNKMARLIAGYLVGAGLKIDYTATHSMGEYIENLSTGDYDFIVSGWALDSCSPNDFYTTIFGLGGVESTFGGVWKSDEFESLILQARATVSVKTRMQLYRQAEEEFFGECPFIVLAHPNRLSAHRKGVTGLKFGPTAELRLGMVSKN